MYEPISGDPGTLWNLGLPTNFVGFVLKSVGHVKFTHEFKKRIGIYGFDTKEYLFTHKGTILYTDVL